jgi:hypothetical protein
MTNVNQAAPMATCPSMNLGCPYPYLALACLAWVLVGCEGLMAPNPIVSGPVPNSGAPAVGVPEDNGMPQDPEEREMPAMMMDPRPEGQGG